MTNNRKDFLDFSCSSTKSKASKKDLDYNLYKYTDLQNQWILCQGHLNYRSVQIKLLKISQFAMYYVVLAKIPIENEKQIMIIYLYRNQKHKPSIVFQLNQYEKILDYSTKSIKISYYLFELIGKDSTDVEIFGAHNLSEREKWVKFIQEALIWTKENCLLIDLPVILREEHRRNWQEDSTIVVENDDDAAADVRSNYEPFSTKLRPVFPLTNSILSLPNAHVHHQQIDEAYIIADNNSQSTFFEERVLTWNDIFYSNEYDDHIQILNNISEIGAFLVRPHLKTSESSDHQYTLCVYTFGGIIKYKILCLSNGKTSLVSNSSEPNFDSICDLCQYYRDHWLPNSINRDKQSKDFVGDLCLKSPYTFYMTHSNIF